MSGISAHGITSRDEPAIAHRCTSGTAIAGVAVNRRRRQAELQLQQAVLLRVLSESGAIARKPPIGGQGRVEVVLSAGSEPNTLHVACSALVNIAFDLAMVAVTHSAVGAGQG